MTFAIVLLLVGGVTAGRPKEASHQSTDGGDFGCAGRLAATEEKTVTEAAGGGAVLVLRGHGDQQQWLCLQRRLGNSKLIGEEQRAGGGSKDGSRRFHATYLWSLTFS